MTSRSRFELRQEGLLGKSSFLGGGSGERIGHFVQGHSCVGGKPLEGNAWSSRGSHVLGCFQDRAEDELATLLSRFGERLECGLAIGKYDERLGG
jgi:hypothetical protein